MRRILLYIFLFAAIGAHGQKIYNNEWIDYSKTYYKFKVGATGVFRITQSVLSGIGLASTPAEHFQLWRNGKQVPIYTSVATGAFSPSDYIEFWGERNDGFPDSELYLVDSFHMNRKHSLQTDTAAFFLTVNTNAGQNSRLVTTPFDLSSNTLPAETHFMYTTGTYFRNLINPGRYINAGEFVYSSAYDIGEGWTSVNLGPNQSVTASHQLYLYNAGPQATFSIRAAGNGLYPRRFRVRINNDSIYGRQLDYLSMCRDSNIAVPMATLSSGAANVEITNLAVDQYDRMVVAQFELNYPRQFNFGNQPNFEFELPASASGNYLEISNFNHNNVAPVLLDITNGRRYVCNISNPALVRVILQPSATKRKLVLISQHNSNIASVATFITRNFVNLFQAANHGDYLIISNPLVYGGVTNPVEDYRVYRSTAAGGNFTAKVYEIGELVDQFAFGIKKHPASIRNFLRFARDTFETTPPQFVLLIGHGTTYDQHRYNESNPDIERLNLLPTFGTPASDVLLSAEPRSHIPLTPIGRLAAIDATEVATYLTKVQQHEQEQQTPSPLIADKAWMKNVIHVIGGSDPFFGAQLLAYASLYRDIISDTLFGANVRTFAKSSPDLVEQADEQIEQLINGGVTQILYFGHSSATVLDFNLDNPEQYSNQGKYPIFIVMGCNAGNFYNFNPARFFVKETLSERFTFAEERGSIAYIASSHYGIAHYLDMYNTKTYTAESRTHYGESIGEMLKESVIQVFNQTSFNDFFARFTTEQTTLHGDPAIKPNPHAKPDYVIEEPLVQINPAFISIAETQFQVDAKFLNIGKAINKNITARVTRQLPDGTVVTIFNDTIPGIRYIDSIRVIVPINPTTDKGLNKITITIDADGDVDELFETNNTITKDIFIYEDEARPIYPLNFAIINKQNITLKASTANPFSEVKQYRMEIDTTEFFNSPLKRTQTITSGGGLLEFTPGLTFTDSTVYHWRVSPLDAVGNPSIWAGASFIYLPGSDLGFNQSDFYQHTKSAMERIRIDSASRTWQYTPVINNLFIRSAMYPTGGQGDADFTITVNGQVLHNGGCSYNELIINVYDPVTFAPMRAVSGTTPLHGNYYPWCGPLRTYNFLYLLGDTSSRRKAMDFLENVVPDGAYVVVRTNTYPYDNSLNTYSNVWRGDTAHLGSGRSLYHTLLNQGFGGIDDFDTTTAFVFVYKKNGQAAFTPQWEFTENIYERILMSVYLPTPDSLGFITSPVFGPAREWRELHWRGFSVDTGGGDNPKIDVIGIEPDGTETVVLTGIDVSVQDLSISFVDANTYPFLKLRMRNVDSINLTPYNLRYWRVTYVPVPEGAIAPNILFEMKDTLEVGEPINFKVAFRNVSESDFDSLLVKMIVTDRNNVPVAVPLGRYRPLKADSTLTIVAPISTVNFVGDNTLFVDVNPDNDQPEQFHFNNFLYKKFYVTPDRTNPLMDVTFDGVHILNRDIVSSKPHILIKLKDESKWMILDDTAGVKVQVRFPDGSLRPYHFMGNDTLKFTAAGNAPNADNTASIDFEPYFPQDGEYELIVTGKDRSNNSAGNIEYKVAFQVINKPMISNMLNYPNPFTTSTAFVFTITGSEVPQNLRIQILTITGKIVREITKEELGPLHVGRNITEFKWDGTDMYGQKLANGIYLYRVITNLNGKSLDKYRHEDDNTDKYFNKGYGKMYLMR